MSLDRLQPLSIDGKEVKDGGAGVRVELALGQALPEIDTALVGKSTWREGDGGSTFPLPVAELTRADSRGKRLGGLAISFRPQGARAPMPDDEFAKDIPGFDTLSLYRADVHTKPRTCQGPLETIPRRADRPEAERAEPR